MTPNRELDSDARRKEFEDTTLPFMGALYGSARRLTQGGGDDEAGDLVQETYLRAFRTYDRFTPGTNCRAWLFTIMYSIFINQYHRTRRAPTVSIDELEGRFQRYLESPDDPAATSAMVEIDAARGIRMNPEVDQALRQLPDDFRLPILLVDVDGLSYDEAAETLQCPVGTIRSRLYRGRRLLFAALKEYAATMGFRSAET